MSIDKEQLPDAYNGLRKDFIQLRKNYDRVFRQQTADGITINRLNDKLSEQKHHIDKLEREAKQLHDLQLANERLKQQLTEAKTQRKDAIKRMDTMESWIETEQGKWKTWKSDTLAKMKRKDEMIAWCRNHHRR